FHYFKRVKNEEKKLVAGDHRRIGRDLDLFSFGKGESAMAGSVFWHPAGWLVFQEIISFLRQKLNTLGYEEAHTPVILNKKLWQKSGHWDKYKERMFFTGSLEDLKKEPEFALKPMSCPGNLVGIYSRKQVSYKDLPLKIAEFGTVYRNEAPGEVLGLFRLREFTQDDAHIFCTEEQVKEELKKLIKLCFEIYKTFGLKIDHIELSTKPKDAIGSDGVWANAEKIMEEVLKEEDVEYKINQGDGAFYGPKFDFHLKDILGRTWQLGTIQLDFSMPQEDRLDISYIDENSQKQRPVMIHRAIFGSIERFIGVLLEQYEGNLPVWLSPIQIAILPVSEKFEYLAADFGKALVPFRTKIISGSETVGKRIAETEIQKIPYVLVVGEKEAQAIKENSDLQIRMRTKGVENMSLSDFKSRVEKNISDKSLEL
ncbi:MAG: threonine--tRNA ligase, partial [Patescibacteria group bacterium]|nr:threonine--tRNA ligase [Patescibacteria group bacterium]